MYRFLIALLLLVGTLIVSHSTARAQGPQVYSGKIGDAAYRVVMPSPWNGTLLLYSHIYVPPTMANPALEASDPATRDFLLSHGFALAGSSFSKTGWAVAEAFHDQMALLNAFTQQFGKPARVIAWGHALGGIISAGLVQRYPNLFAGALPMCSVGGGSVGLWNQFLDTAFTFQTLVAPRIQIVHITDPVNNATNAVHALQAAQKTRQGQARIALAAAMSDVPGWFGSNSSDPAKKAYKQREANQFRWEQDAGFAFLFGLRAELEQRAGGNPSWNTNVNYFEQLGTSVDQSEVKALYRQAGLSLTSDLQRLQRTRRVAADRGAVTYLAQNTIFDGRLAVPVLTLHNTADGLVSVQNERAYADTVASAGQTGLLRQLYVHRAGHCAFTSGEMITALATLLQRIDTGQWPDTENIGQFNAYSTSLGSTVNQTAPVFTKYLPAVFQRPYDSHS